MAKYLYSALKNNNQIVTGEIEASNPREAREKIRKLGFVPTKVYTESAFVEPVEQEYNLNTAETVHHITHLSLQEKIMFTSELEVLLSSGIPILEALQSIEYNSPKWKLKEICIRLRNGIMSGMTFAQALSSFYGKVFGTVYTALIKTGEEAGDLEATLQRMLLLLRKQDNIKSKIISASIYPALLIVIMFAVLVIFSKLVFPAFMGFFTFNGASLPFLASILVGICSFVEKFWWFLIICFGALCGGLASLFKNPLFKSKWDTFILKIPVVSEFVQYINLSNFLTVLHISYDGGLPIMSGLELSGKTVGNYAIRKKISDTVNLVRSGKMLSEAFRITGAMPPALMTMIATGEKTGSLGKMFRDTAEVIDKKVDMALDAMTKLFEPTLIVIMGIVVLFIVVAFVQMYYGMLGSLF